MHDNKHDDVLDGANCVPPFLAVRNPLNECDAEWVIKDQLSNLEVNTVLGLIDFVLCLISFDPHLYLHCSTYMAVKSGAGGVTHAL